MSNNKGAHSRLPFHKALISYLTVFLTWLCLTAILFSAMFPRTQALKAGDVAESDIRATREVVDKVTTESLRQAARDSVQEKYYEDNLITEKVLNDLEVFIEATKAPRKLCEQDRKAYENALKENETQETKDYTPSDELVARCRSILPVSFTDNDIITLITADSAMLESLWTQLRESISSEMQSGVKQEYMNDSLDRIGRSLSDDTKPLHSLALSIAAAYMAPNFLYDETATRIAQDNAAATVADVVYKEKQNIVQAGEVISPAQIEMLSELGLNGSDRSTVPLRAMCMSLHILAIVCLPVLYIQLFHRKVWNSVRNVVMINTLLLTTVVLTLFTSYFNLSFMVTALCAMTLTVLIDHECAMAVNISAALLCGMLAGAGSGGTIGADAIPVITATIASGSASIFIVSRSPQRSTMLSAGLVSGLVSAFVIAVYNLMQGIQALSVINSAGLAFLGGFFASLIALGILPLFEVLFKVVTQTKLMELCNPNHTLLKRLMLEAPGTYNHSIMVGNLAESAADAIGANSLLVRTGAYYHDVGKLKRPFFFKENQLSGAPNPHDDIEPTLSAQIIRTHTTDGVEMAKRYRIPQAILDIIVQHHGDTLIAYFYSKALEQAPPNTKVSDAQFRYSGPRPTSREAAIIMMADSVEAASRTLEHKTPEALEELIQRIVHHKLEDGQFNDCAITISEIEIVCATFKNVLTGVYHDRVAYPDLPAVRNK